ncbi:substrate-binding domain-containing protein [Pseudonocardia sp. CA-107938]|uniref:substrate-binding domain-containing protein n=1 Tax=Pseudonocardia sp. CA-107938 TaxID=3240021 RepID=UPI003D9219F5
MATIRTTALIAALALTGTVLASCAGSGPASTGAAPQCAQGPITVGIIPKLGTDPYMTTVRDGAQRAATESGGKVIYTEPSEATGAAQIPFVNQLVSQGVDVIAISGSDLNSASSALQRAREAGIDVISFDSDVSADARSLFINQADSAELGQKMLDSMATLIDKKGQFAVLSSTQTAVNQNAWIADMQKRLKSDPEFSGMELVTVVYGEEKADVNAQKARELAQTYPELKGIIVPAGIGLPAAAEALSQTGDLGRIKLTGLAPATLISSYIKSGNVQDIWWNVNDLGYLAFHAATALATCKLDPKAGSILKAGSLGDFTVGESGVVILGPATVVTPQNVSSFKF